MPGPYTAQEYANMHLIYGECLSNGNAAARMYRERYPNAERHPNSRVFIHVHRSLSEGRFPNQVFRDGRPSRYEEKVLQAVEKDPSISLREIEKRVGVSRSAAQRILQNNRLNR